MRNTTRTNSVSAALLFTPSSNLRLATSLPRPQSYVSTLTSMTLLLLHAHILTPPTHKPLASYARDTYSDAQLQKGKEMGLDEAAQAEPVSRSEKDTHDIEGRETVHATVPKHKCRPKVYSKAFHSRRWWWAEVMFTLNSRDLRMCFSMISSRIISFQKVMVQSRQALHPFLTL